MRGGNDDGRVLSIHLNVPEPEPERPVPEDRVRAALTLVLDEEGLHAGELSVTFVSDRVIHRLNREYLGHDRPTDVLAFALHEEGEPPIGDVYVGVDEAGRQAREHGVPVEEELVRLAVHGTLHVLGYDHPEGEGREESDLFRKQEAVIRKVMA